MSAAVRTSLRKHRKVAEMRSGLGEADQLSRDRIDATVVWLSSVCGARFFFFS